MIIVDHIATTVVCSLRALGMCDGTNLTSEREILVSNHITDGPMESIWKQEAVGRWTRKMNMQEKMTTGSEHE